MGQWVAWFVERHILRKLYRELVFGYRHNTTLVTVDKRDWASPIALTRHTPISQAVLCRACADAQFFNLGHGFFFSLIDGKPIKKLRINKKAIICVGLALEGKAFFAFAIWANHNGNIDIVFLSKFVIALVVCRHTHDGSCSIVHQHVVTDIERDFNLRVERIDNFVACIKSNFFGLLNGGLGCTNGLTRFFEGVKALLACCQPRCKRMIK